MKHRAFIEQPTALQPGLAPVVSEHLSCGDQASTAHERERASVHAPEPAGFKGLFEPSRSPTIQRRLALPSGDLQKSW